MFANGKDKRMIDAHHRSFDHNSRNDSDDRNRRSLCSFLINIHIRFVQYVGNI